MNVDAGTLAAGIAAFNVAITLVGGGVLWGRVTGRMDAHEANTTRIEAAVHAMSALLVTSAVEADRLRRAEADIENVENDLRNLRRGVGWIKDDGAHGVNREY